MDYKFKPKETQKIATREYAIQFWNTVFFNRCKEEEKYAEFHKRIKDLERENLELKL